MALNGIILYFPWGAGGNLVKNILSIDTNFEFIDDQPFNLEYPTEESRYEFLKSYYLQPVSSDNWLHREWTIRRRPHNKYFYFNGVGYWNPECKLIYDIHGTPEEIMSITLDQKLRHYNRVAIEEGRCSEQLSPWTIQECEHVFLMADNIQTFIDIYASKNHDLDRTHPKFNQHFLDEAINHNNFYHNRLTALESHLRSRNRSVTRYSAEMLFRDSGYNLIEDIKSKLNLSIPSKYIADIHSIWLTSTRELYYNSYNKPLDI